MSGRMTNQQWEAQNGALHPDEARAKGLCWHCSGKGANYSAFGGEQIKVTCPECKGTGKDQR
jgi:DnaJ-class molecular chaperone